MADRTNSLPAPDLFQGFSDEERREVERVTTTRAFRKGEVIYTPGETGEALFLREEEGEEVRALTHQDIAERLGVYRDTATNALNELKSAALISIGRKRIAILDRERLQRIAGE